MKHFGVTLIKRKYSLNLTKEEFALIDTRPSLPMFENLVQINAYTDSSGTQYRKEWCEQYRECCLRNYDLNMSYFAKLDEEDFNKCIENFIKKYNQFYQIDDLSNFNKVTGYYIMVLDNYKQVYIGKTNNIKKRIQQHWSKTKPFDRTLFPMYNENSCFSVDFFRALDTTRIFVWPTEIIDQMEAKLVEDFPEQYRTNRIGGDIENNGLLALLTLNTRKLS